MRGGCAPEMEALLRLSIEAKRAVVQEDERESGARMLLNLGHTFAHVIEPMKSLDLTHGEAVSIGLHAAAAAAVELGEYSEAQRDRLCALLASIGLPTTIACSAPIGELIATMRYDKKANGGRVRLVLPTSSGACVRDDVSEAVIETAWRAVILPSSN